MTEPAPSNPWLTWEHSGVRRPGRRFAHNLALRYHRLELLSPYPLSETDPAIIVCNHTSYVDPLFLQAGCPRLIVWMIAKEYYDLPVANWVCRNVGAIPVARNGRDMTATRLALRALEQGRVLGIFPEGRLETGPELLPFQAGPALLAARSGAPLVPAALEGTQRQATSLFDSYITPQRVTLRFGAPIHLPSDTSHDALEAATTQLRQAVASLRTLSVIP